MIEKRSGVPWWVVIPFIFGVACMNVGPAWLHVVGLLSVVVAIALLLVAWRRERRG